MKVRATYLASAGYVRDSKGRIAIKLVDMGEYFDAAVQRLKDEVPGVRWRKAQRIWTAPATVEVCHALRSAFPKTLEVSDVLAEWYLEHAQEAAQQAARADLTDAQLIRLPQAAPVLFSTLRPDQRAGVAWCAAGYRGGGIVADEPGLGKTLVTIGGVIEADLRGPVLVTCPRLSVKRVWLKELHRWAPDEHVYIARGTRRQRQRALDKFFADEAERKWLIIVAEMLRVKRAAPAPDAKKSDKKKRGRVVGYEYPELFDRTAMAGGWAAVISDESHRLLGSLSVVKSNLMGEGLAHLPLRPSRWLRAVTGTPFGKGGRVQGMFGTLHWMWPDEYTSFWRWAERHFEIDVEEVYIAGGRGKTRTTRKIGGLREGKSGEEFLKSLGPRILRRTKEELLPDLPLKQFIEVDCEMDSVQLKQYKQLTDDAEVVVLGGLLMANGVLAERTRARQLANGAVWLRDDGKVQFAQEHSCKVDQLMDILDQHGVLDGSSLKKVIVASQYNAFLYGAVIPALEKAGCEYHLLTGKTSDKQRDRMMDEFQGEGGPQVFVMNSKAGGISVTLDAADDVHQLDRLDNPEDEQQLYDRAHRASRMHQVTIYRYETEGTIDKNVAEAVGHKEDEQFAVLDGRRGLEYLRSVIRYKPPQED